MDELATPVTEDMLNQALNFAIDYDVSGKKYEQGRTSGQARGLGGIIDSFVPGKVIELAVCEILNKISTDKACSADFGVREKQDFSEPDIATVTENSAERKPKVNVETKNSAENYRWVGVYDSQFSTLLEGQPDLDKIYFVFCSIRRKDASKNGDLLGALLKSKDFLPGKFASYESLDNFFIQIDNVLTGRELKEKGQYFPSGMILPDDEILAERRSPYRQDGSLGKGFKKLMTINGKKKLPTKKITWIKQFGETYCEGRCEVFLKTGVRKGEPTDPSLYLHCLGDVVVDNEFLGKFPVSPGTYSLKVRSVSGRPKSSDDWWVAKRNIDSVVGATTIKRVREIAKKI